MLLREDANKLWQELSRTNKAPTNGDVEKWSSETFLNVKTIKAINGSTENR